jgi:hypothetical protein
VTGTLFYDNDVGLCPATAVIGPCGAAKRETVVEALERRVKERAAQPQTSKLRFMKSRSDKWSD